MEQELCYYRNEERLLRIKNVDLKKQITTQEQAIKKL